MINIVVSYVKRKMAPQPVKVRSDIEVTCFEYDGIDAIKGALLAGQEKSTAEAPVKINLIAPPMYVMTCVTVDKDHGVETLNAANEAIRAFITEKGYKIFLFTLFFLLTNLFFHYRIPVVQWISKWHQRLSHFVKKRK